MQDLFTYASLGSLTGAVTATILLVQFLKVLGPTERLPTRWLALAIAEGIVALCNIATGEFLAANIPLYFLNGLLVAASAMGSWHVLHNLSGTTRKNGRRFMLESGTAKAEKARHPAKEMQRTSPNSINPKFYSRYRATRPLDRH